MSNLAAAIITLAAVLILVLATAQAITRQGEIDDANLDRHLPKSQRAEIVGVTK